MTNDWGVSLMRAIAIALSVSLALLAVPATAKSTSPSASQTRMQTCAANWKAMTPDQKKATTYKDYSKTCLAGGTRAAAPAATTAPAPIAAPPAKATGGSAMGAAPAGATGLCKDGTYTMSKTHSGSCSHHGGVAKWL
jgi:hypothetical protein